MARIAVDFDGTLHLGRFPEIGDPNRDLIEALGIWVKGSPHNTVMIHSCRVNTHWPEPERGEKIEEMLRWLNSHQVPFHEVWGLTIYRRLEENPWQPVVHWNTNPGDVGKPVADFYLDDLAARRLEDLWDHDTWRKCLRPSAEDRWFMERMLRRLEEARR